MDENQEKDLFIELRTHAETMLQERSDQWNTDIPEDIERLIHELRVYQIELELQNEELRTIRQRLESARDTYVDLYDFAPVSYFTIDDAGMIMDVNLTGSNLLGVARNTLINTSFTRFIVPEDQDIYYFYRKSLGRTPYPQMCEIRLKKHDGSRFYARLDGTVVTRRESCIGQYRIIVTDVTKRKQAEVLLRREHEDLEKRVKDRTAELVQLNATLQHEIAERKRLEEAYRTLVDHSVLGLAIFQNEQIVFANAAMMNLTGYSVDYFQSLFSRDIQTIVHHEDQEKLRKHLTACLEGRTVLPHEYRIIHRSSETRWAEIHTSLIRYQGNPALQITFIDITQRKRIEAELQSTREFSEAIIRSRSHFLTNLSHQIRTPLNTIIGIMTLLHNTDLSPGQQELIEIAHSSGRTLLMTIKNVLILSRCDSGKLSLVKQPFRLRDCIEDSLDFITTDADMKQLRVNYVLDPESPEMIIGDMDHLRQILMNVLNNAVKFTEQGNILLTVTSKKLSDGDGDSRFQRFTFTFMVRDTGIGIPQEKQSQLFNDFDHRQIFSDHEQDVIGIGLIVCKRLVEMMDGSIWVESETGQGSTFHFTITTEAFSDKNEEHAKSLSSQKQKGRETPLENPSGSPQATRILLAEDNLTNQKIIKRILERMNYSVDLATNGKQVLDKITHQTYHIILMDVQMPEMDGFVTTRHIRETLPSEQQPYIIALTALALEGDQEKCLSAGMNDYVSKPVGVSELREKLSKFEKKRKNLTHVGRQLTRR